MARLRTRSKVFDAVLALAFERPVGAMSMEGIAARAGVSKQTLYRTWPSPGAIVFDALLARTLDDAGEVSVPDSGDLEADLRLLVSSMIDELTDPTQNALLRVITAELQMNEALAVQFREQLMAPQLQAIATRFERAGVQCSWQASELLLGAVLHRWLLRSGSFDHDWVEGHVARVMRAAAPTDTVP